MEELFKSQHGEIVCCMCHANQHMTALSIVLFLFRNSFRKVLMAHSLLSSKTSLTAPSSAALRMLFLASAIPFVGFGFLDNFIM